MMTGPEIEQALWFAAAGVVGAGLRALLSQSQTFLIKRTIADLVLGAITGIIYPLVQPIPIPAHANLVQQAAFIAGVSYVADHVLVNMLGSFGAVQHVVGPANPGDTP